MDVKIKVLSTVAFVLFLNACGGGGGGSRATTSVGVDVIDPPLNSSLVTIKCGDYTKTGVTDANGHVDISVYQDQVSDKTKCQVSTLGGVDTDGDNFKDITMLTPLALYDDMSNIVVSPITTLVAYTQQNGSDLNASKSKVASLLNINQEDITKKPTSDISLQKTSKILSKVALLTKTDGEKVGFEAISKSEQNATAYLDTLETNGQITQTTSVKETINAINSSASMNDLLKQSIISNILPVLKQAYKDDSNYALANLKTLSEKIAEANKNSDGTYKSVNRYQVRKALSDVSLIPSFDANITLASSIKTILTKNESDFSTYLQDKNISISSINGIMLYNASSYPKILTNNAERIEYYTFSNKSHLAKILSLVENSYDDTLLNPIYAKVAYGFAKLGFEDEAQNMINVNIYDEYNKISGSISVAYALMQQGKTDTAKNLLDRAYEQTKSYYNDKGAENLSSNDIFLGINTYAGYVNLEFLDKAQEVMDWLEDNVNSKVTNVVIIGRMAVNYRNVIRTFIEDDRIDDAKLVFKNAARFLQNVNYTKDNARTTTNNIALIAILGPILDDNTLTNKLLEKLDSVDTQFGTNYAKLSSVKDANYTEDYASWASHLAATRALNGELSVVLEKINSGGIYSQNHVCYTPSYCRNTNNEVTDAALNYGVAAAMYIDGNATGTMDMIYKYQPFKDYLSSIGSQIYRWYAPLTVSGDLDISRVLKAYDKTHGTNFMVNFYVDLVNDMQTRPWEGLSDKAISKYIINPKYGLPVVIRHFDAANETDKRDDMMSKAINIATNMSDTAYQLSAYNALVKVANDLSLPQNDNVTILTQKVQTLINNLDLNSSSSTYSDRVSVIVDQSKYFAHYLSLDDAKQLNQKIYNSLPEGKSGDKSSIEARMKYALGWIGYYKGKFSSDYYRGYLIDAFVQSKDIAFAEKVIDELRENVATLGTSLDAMKDYVVIARSYAAIGNIEKTKETINKINTLQERNLAIKLSAGYFANYDLFAFTSSASVDTDGDGKPDFFTLGAKTSDIAKSGLSLDDDIDGDGVSVDKDNYPYDPDKN